ncbi:Rhs family protein [Photobacterium sp. SKA34]|uniref:ElyC/SanA/YdcF family protein n=1 Tax=Photobacterium sp. SKA34 TaxID=121723 RepID=UPI00006BBEFE|nr:ElyC/SanA/YdcF family protein [Photobacterium sp. SKA34]EAR53981.1 Rhs family protein [Photobacterium sp. SKA34]
MSLKQLLLFSTAISISLTACHSEHKNISPMEKPIDLIITLGLEVNRTSCTPRQLLEYRADRAYEVAKSLENPIYLLTGKGNPTTVQTCVIKGKSTEAQALKKILIEKHHVKENQIILEQNSTTTDENAIEAKIIIDKLKDKGVNINSYQLVSSHYHIFRGNETIDKSAMKSFNAQFGENFFTPKNSYRSSEFSKDEFWSSEFNIQDGWSPQESTLALGDINGDGKSDLVGFKSGELVVGLSSGKQFNSPQSWGSYVSDDQKPIRYFVADINKDHFADAISINNENIEVALSTGSKFDDEISWGENNFDLTKDIIQMADIDGDGLTDIGIFSENGTYAQFNKGDHFEKPEKISNSYGHKSTTDPAHSETFDNDTEETTIRQFADVNGDKRQDIVSYGHHGIYVSLQDNDGDFSLRSKWLRADDGEGDKEDFLDWSNKIYVRKAVDMTGNGRADLLNIGRQEIYIALSTGKRYEYLGSVTSVYTLNNRLPIATDHWKNFVKDASFDSADNFRLIGDIDGNGLPDIVGVKEFNTVVTRNLHP